MFMIWNRSLLIIWRVGGDSSTRGSLPKNVLNYEAIQKNLIFEIWSQFKYSAFLKSNFTGGNWWQIDSFSNGKKFVCTQKCLSIPTQYGDQTRRWRSYWIRWMQKPHIYMIKIHDNIVKVYILKVFACKKFVGDP